MVLLAGIILLVLTVVLIALDLSRKIHLTHLLPLTAIVLMQANAVVLAYLVMQATWNASLPIGLQIWLAVAAAPLLLYLLLRITVFPVIDGCPTGIRLKAMIGGRFLIYRSLWMMVVQAVFLLAAYRPLLRYGVPHAALMSNIVCSAVFLFLLLMNGIVRLLCTSRRLSIVRRLVMVVTMWIPLVNWIVLGHACRLARDEYDFALHKKDLELTRAHSDICRTKYPLLMVHGVLFRDLKFFNYWGRVPKELLRYGATIYYGNQEAVGTIEHNGDDIHKRILEMLEETGSEKVNIIAHSKGGLDSRYAIHKYGLGEQVATLTTISTPHHGCLFVDKLLGILPDALVRFLDRTVNAAFGKLGDKNPNFYDAVHQFTTDHSASFNEEVVDSPQVYYQSFATRMRNCLSDTLLSFPYLLIKPLEGKNDGLVSVGSAQWGEFRGVLESTSRRGISHGDIIDLKREDYRGFDVVETYVGIVSELKQKGF